jgi:hypothetical protein
MSDAAKFTYNSMIKMPTTEEFSFFPAMEEGGTGEFSDESYDTEARKNSPLAA